MVGGADAAIEIDVASSSLRDRPHNEHDMGSAETDNLQRANQTEPVVNTNVFDEPPLSIRGEKISLTSSRHKEQRQHHLSLRQARFYIVVFKTFAENVSLPDKAGLYLFHISQSRTPNLLCRSLILLVQEELKPKSSFSMKSCLRSLRTAGSRALLLQFLLTGKCPTIIAQIV